MAKRYDQKKKDEVVAFIQNYNKENGRGGQSAAVKKYKLNPITVRNWLENAGVPTAGKSAKKKRKTSAKASPATKPTSRKTKSRRTRSRKGSSSKAAPASVSAKLKRMMAVQEQIEALSSEYEALKKSL